MAEARVLVTGGTGLLGWWVVRELVGRGLEVYATYHVKRPAGSGGASWVGLDLEDLGRVRGVVGGVRPGVVVHCAAYTDVDGCETDRGRAYRVNYLGSRVVAEACRGLGAFLVYVSTDYVFDGARGLYSESDVPSPVNFYGLSKLLGEASVESLCPGSSCVVRVSGLYGCSPYGRRNFGLFALERLSRGEEVRAFADQFLSPSYVVALARAIAEVVEKRVTGVLHVAGERVSRYGFALALARALGVDEGLVKPVPMEDLGLPARRPRDSSLDVSRARGLGIRLPPLSDCLRDFVGSCGGSS